MCVSVLWKNQAAVGSWIAARHTSTNYLHLPTLETWSSSRFFSCLLHLWFSFSSLWSGWQIGWFHTLLVQCLKCGSVIYNCTLSFLKGREKGHWSDSRWSDSAVFAGRFAATLFSSSLPSLLSHTPLFVFVHLLKSDNQSHWLKRQSFIIYLFSSNDPEAFFFPPWAPSSALTLCTSISFSVLSVSLGLSLTSWHVSSSSSCSQPLLSLSPVYQIRASLWMGSLPAIDRQQFGLHTVSSTWAIYELALGIRTSITLPH